PLSGFFPSFARATSFAIGRQGVFSLAGWAPRIRTHFHVLSRTQVPDREPSPFAYGTITRCGRTFQNVRLRYKLPKHRSYNPTGTSPRGLGCVPFARRYSGNRCFFLFLRVLRCFSSPGWPRTPMDSVHGNSGIPGSTPV